MSNEVEHCLQTKKNTSLTSFPFQTFDNGQTTYRSYDLSFKLPTTKVVSESSRAIPNMSSAATTNESNKKRTRAEFECDNHKKSVTKSAVKASAFPLTSESKNICEKSFKFKSSCAIDKNPETYVKNIFESHLGFQLNVRPTLELSSQPSVTSQSTFFPPITEENINGYDINIVTATRDEDISTLRALHSTGHCMSCCNRFGESLLHMACRRGFTSIVKFLVEEAGVPIRITDDCGRTPLHDALWNRECQFEIFNALVRIDPALLFVSDKRGHTPFAYARKDKWENWITHIKSIKGELIDSLDLSTMELFRENAKA